VNVLVVGGAGYIGSHMVKRLAAAGHGLVVFDNLSRGFRDAVIAGEIVVGDLASREQLDAVFGSMRIDAVMHFASLIEVAESVREPGQYYQNNLAYTLNLLDTMVAHDVKQIIFSSSAAVFGKPSYVPIDEGHPKNPINPYGRSKLMVEEILEDYDRAFGLKSVSLRYFNAAGADPDGDLGERHNPETHLIPLVLQAASARRNSISIYGDDYDTPDGTCIRDYIHVQDLCDAHLLALEYLDKNQQTDAFNLGNGNGFSVREVVDRVREVTGRDFDVRMEPRRVGDPAVLAADSGRARSTLGWEPKLNNLETIIETAWRWEQSFFSQ
jgi:UDP-glucose 4-epimerase